MGCEDVRCATNAGMVPPSTPQHRRADKSSMSRLLSLVAVLAAASTLLGDDTAGCMVQLNGFSHQRLTELTWTAEITEYDTAPPADNLVRIEYNFVNFTAGSKTMDVAAMIQNVGHLFSDDAFGTISNFPALGLYFSSLQKTFSDSQHGVQLNVSPTNGPQFGRIFENVDRLGYSAKNVYTRTKVGTPSIKTPVIVQWIVTRGDTVVDPSGNYSKDLKGSWIGLKGKFVKWNFAVLINGTRYDVADYYLPFSYAEYISASDPLVLHQEYFGSATTRLRSQKGKVRYTELHASDGNQWYPLNNWRITQRIDDGAGNLDDHFGWRSDGDSLSSSVGHDDDPAKSARDKGHIFSLHQVALKELRR